MIECGSNHHGMSAQPVNVRGQRTSRLPGLVKDLKLITVEGGPHHLGWTHSDEVNTVLLDFLAG
jgi:hypothetical protein